ncbi:MAG TPA: hypothetical protein VNG51_18120 [Ktedonobacteraceae bacterium]|nr:hypothetical protein [Ktedonobacteraceae bacterium]
MARNMKETSTQTHMDTQDAFPEEQPQVVKREPMVVDVQIQQPARDCPIYTWDREQACLRVNGIHPAEPGLPADRATFLLESELAVPVFLVAPFSFPPLTTVQVRILGALGYPFAASVDDTLPTDGWMFVAVMVADNTFSAYESLTMLPQHLRQALESCVCNHIHDASHLQSTQVTWCEATTAARLIRETRLLLKRKQRNQTVKQHWLKRAEETPPVAWRAIEGLNDTQRQQIQQERFLHDPSPAPHTQAERLIRFVPQRFQHVLADLLHESEQVLAFVERPLLRHGTGLPGSPKWRSNQGILLVTDRQILWLRDCFTPGTANFLPGGYIARMAPLERIQDVSILPPGKVPAELRAQMGTKDSPYLHLLLEVASSGGSEVLSVEFPHVLEVEKALAHITALLGAFLPYQDGQPDRRVRCLPSVEAWVPQGAEAEQLEKLGGIVSAALTERLEARLGDHVRSAQEEVLTSTLVPALDDDKNPARLIALTRHELIVIDDTQGSARRWSKTKRAQGETIHRFDIGAVSSAQLHYSLVGSTLSIVEPQPAGQPRHHVFPFHSPAIARFVPLFTRLSTLLRMPYTT